MNTKISKLLGIGLTIAVLASLLVTGTPASAGTLSWSAESGMPTNDTTVNQLVSGSDVNDFAVADDGNTVYAVATTANLTFKSTNGGAAWSRLTPSGLASLDAPQFVAVAPGDANYVVVVGDTTEVYFSKDGGATFDLLPSAGFTLTAVNDVAISAIVSGVRNIALAGNTAGAPDVQYLNQGASVALWTSMSTGTDWVTGTGFAAGVSINAIAFSPNYASDRVLVAVNLNVATNNATLQMASFSSKKWNANAGFSDYPVTIIAATSITKASLALAPTYLGADSSTRLAFVGLTSSGTTSGLYRVIDTTVTANLLTTSTGINSVAFNGSSLIAGAAATNKVFYCSNPTASASAITITEVTQYQRPGGPNGTATNVIVAWGGANVFAGTSGAMSAFSVSKDNGVTFNDISLIDGATADVLTNITDVAASADGATVYMVSNDGVNTSVWRKTTAWERVLSLDATVSAFILRLAPENASNVYLTQLASTNMYFSNDSGEKSWSLRSLVAAPVDVAVESAQVVYALTNGGMVYKSTNSGFTWDAGVTTGLTTGATITSVKANQILVGGSDGSVAWSTDGSASATTWKAMTGASGSTNPKPSSTSTNALTGNVQLVADKLDAGGFIFATSSKAAPEVFRWTVGTSTGWSDIIVGSIPGGLPGSATNTGTTAATGAMAYGMALNGKVLYVLSNNGTVSFYSRTLDATKAGSTSPTGDWSALAVSAPTGTSPSTFNIGPQALKFSSTAGKFWAIGNGATDKLFSFTDTTYKVAPTITGPADAYVPQTNPVSGKAQDIAFSWARLGSTVVANGYQLDIALDSGFNQVIFQASPLTTGNTLATTLSDPVVALVGPDQPAASTKGGNYNFAPDTTYYWRVRAISPMESLWSTARSFSFSSLKPFVQSGPAMGATAVSVNPILSWTSYTGAKWYELTLSEDPSFAIPEWSHNVYNLFYGITADETLKFNTTYYWRVRGVTGDPYVQGSKVITPAGPYATGAFTTMAEAVTSTPAVIISTVTSSAPPTVITVPIVQTEEQPIPSWMLMTIIVIGLVLIIALVVLIVRTRRVA